MSFADDVSRQISTPAKCKMCSYIGGLDKKDREEIESVLADSSFPAAAIARALKARNFDVSESTIIRHRYKNHVI